MRTFAQQPRASEKLSCASATRAGIASNPVSSSKDSAPRFVNFLQDFSRVPVRTPSFGGGQLVQRKATPRANVKAVPPIAHEALRSPGQPLDAQARRFMEPRFGWDFSRVRVHSDSQAGRAARAVGARAYTVGQNIVFAEGEFAPHGARGQRLLAHELTHTIQQGDMPSRVGMGRLRLGPDRDPFEQDAERVSASILSVPSYPQQLAASFRHSGAPATVQRQRAHTDEAPKKPAKEPPPEKKDEGKDTGASGSQSPAATTAIPAGCKLSTKTYCSPQAVADAEFIKHGPQDAFGVTNFKPDNSAAAPPPEVATKSAGKEFVLQPTTAVPVSCESFFVQTDEVFNRSTPIDTSSPDQKSMADQCPGGKYVRQYRMLKEGAEKVKQAEMDHCRDLQYAFDISVGCFAAIVNKLAGTHFPSQEAAEKAVTKRVGGLPPDKWAEHYKDLCEKTKLRDSRKWHTPPTKKGPRERIDKRGPQCYSAQETRIDETVYPEVGEGMHPSSEIIK